MTFIGHRSVIKTAAKLFSVIIFTALLVFGAVILGLRIKHQHFYGSAFKEFEVLGLSGGFVPQGLDYCEEQSVFLISGYEPSALQSYRKDGEAQRKDPYFLTHAHERTRSPHPQSGHGCPIPYYIYRNGPDDGP